MAAHAADAYFRVSHKLAVLNVHLSPGLTNALTGVVDRRRRLDADGRDRRQHAVVPPRARAASGHPLPRRRVAGRHLPAVLQARLARRRREVPGRRDAARAERRADRPARARCCSTCRWTCSRSRSTRAVVTVARRPELRPVRRRRTTASPKRRELLVDGASAGHLRRQRRAAVRSDRRTARAGGAADMPVATTLMGKGVFPEDHPLALGMTGIWGTRVGERNDARAPTSSSRSARLSARPTAARGIRSTPSRFRRRG